MDLKEEKKLWEKGFQRVVGLDEAGRGALAGPVVAAAVLLKNSKSECRPAPFAQYQKVLLYNQAKVFNNGQKVRGGFRASDLKIRDSKKLTPKARDKFYKILVIHPGIRWGIGRVSEKVIDKINILEATKLAMKRAIKNLEKKLIKWEVEMVHDRGLFNQRRKTGLVDFLILDGKIKIDLDVPQKSIVNADGKVFSCAASSIIAKCQRDEMMRKYDKKYPQYGFSKHKGYPTKYHKKMLRKFGSCKIHRKSFRPVFKLKMKRKKVKAHCSPTATRQN